MGVEKLQQFFAGWLGPVEEEMRAILHREEAAVAAHYGMMRYHLGWADASFRAEHLPSGKRLRPLLCLMACQEVGGDPRRALPAAAAVEILHNFSLVHDDVEDGDELRRHRPTVWAIWGVPQAVNVGDGMFALAFAALQRLPQAGVDAQNTLAALRLFTDMCLALTEGQHLDMSFERRSDVTVAEYMRMIHGKTAALIGASLAIGGLVGGATRTQDRALQRFGQAIGLAFQIQDDLLGIWGDPAVTGKAAGNDLLRKKKSYPLLYALNAPVIGAELAALVDGEDFGPAALPQALDLLDRAQARAATETEMRVRYEEGMAALRAALGPQSEQSLLWAFAEWLLRRQA
jgi:geranylgeranyl diphosphate synthase type I